MFISPRLLSKPSNFSHSVISTISTSLFFPHIFSLICSLDSNSLHMAWITPLQKWSRNNFRALISLQLSEALFYDRPLVVAVLISLPSLLILLLHTPSIHLNKFTTQRAKPKFRCNPSAFRDQHDPIKSGEGLKILITSRAVGI